jgi:hypothetical protein
LDAAIPRHSAEATLRAECAAVWAAAASVVAALSAAERARVVELVPVAGATNRLFRRTIFSLIAFGIAFGFLEASVVVYLRVIGHSVRAAAGIPPDALFPLIKIEQIGSYLKIVKIEAVREASTIVMLVTVALAATRNARTWMAAFALVFGVWDLAFYASLRIMIGWPSSFGNWDLLFLIPVPWTGPVLAPSIVAASLVVGGILALMRQPPRVDRLAWMLLLAGGVVVFVSFIWEWRDVVAGTMPKDFPWAIFTAGELIAIAGFARAMKYQSQLQPE